MSARDRGRAGLLVLAIMFALRVAAAAPPIEEIRQAVRTGDVQRVESLLNEHAASLAGSDAALLHEAAAAGVRQLSAKYQSRLDPPPGAPTDAGSNSIRISEQKVWPAHIYPPRRHTGKD